MWCSGDIEEPKRHVSRPSNVHFCGSSLRLRCEAGENVEEKEKSNYVKNRFELWRTDTRSRDEHRVSRSLLFSKLPALFSRSQRVGHKIKSFRYERNFKGKEGESWLSQCTRRHRISFFQRRRHTLSRTPIPSTVFISRFFCSRGRGTARSLLLAVQFAADNFETLPALSPPDETTSLTEERCRFHKGYDQGERISDGNRSENRRVHERGRV